MAARFVADLLQGMQDRLVGILRAACVLPAGVDLRLDIEHERHPQHPQHIPGEAKRVRGRVLLQVWM